MTIATLAQPAELYERDFYLWTQTQVAALRAAAASGANLPVDWANVAEEIESLGQSDARAVRSRLRQIMVHLLKLSHSPAQPARSGWIDEIGTLRADLDAVLADSPSLRRRVPEFVGEEWEKAVRLAKTSLQQHGEAAAAERLQAEAVPFTTAELMEDWLPGDSI